MLGVMSSRQALEIADQAGLDLVKISPNAVPPVCKILDYGKFKFELLKRQKEAKKKGGVALQHRAVGGDGGGIRILHKAHRMGVAHVDQRKGIGVAACREGMPHHRAALHRGGDGPK